MHPFPSGTAKVSFEGLPPQRHLGTVGSQERLSSAFASHSNLKRAAHTVAPTFLPFVLSAASPLDSPQGSRSSLMVAASIVDGIVTLEGHPHLHTGHLGSNRSVEQEAHTRGIPHLHGPHCPFRSKIIPDQCVPLFGSSEGSWEDWDWEGGSIKEVSKSWSELSSRNRGSVRAGRHFVRNITVASVS